MERAARVAIDVALLAELFATDRPLAPAAPLARRNPSLPFVGRFLAYPRAP